MLNAVLMAGVICPPGLVHPDHDHYLASTQPVVGKTFEGWPDHKDHAADPRETHLSGVRQLTFGGQNAEAYWNLAGDKLTFQSRQPGFPDEQIFTMNADGSGRRLVSTGLGRCTCSYFSPDGKWIYFSSTHAKDKGAQKPVDMSKGYVWMVNPNFALYKVRPNGKGLRRVRQLPGYFAEATIAPDGSYMTWTSDFEGDLEIYRSDLDGRNIRRLTSEEGYDGGPFVSWDGKQIVYRRSLPFANDQERQEYRALLAEHLVRPSKLEIWVMSADGANKRRVTDLGAASFAPFLHPDGKRVIFSSNFHDPKRREFDLFICDLDGSNLKQVTFTPEFDGFPMFTRDGKKLVWASNRHGAVPGETNIFVTDWKD